jgi:hypothetical protein
MMSLSVSVSQKQIQQTSNTVKHVFKCHLWDKEKVAFYDKWHLKRGSIHIKCLITGLENGDLLIQVTA